MSQKRPNRVLGGPHDEFWAWCDKRELRLQRCASCQELAWPVVETCENCGGADLAWERMSGEGKIVSWCTFERDYYGGALSIPWDTIVVELAEGPYFISNPGNFIAADIEPSMPVTLAFEPCEDTQGPFLLPVFNHRG